MDATPTPNPDPQPATAPATQTVRLAPAKPSPKPKLPAKVIAKRAQKPVLTPGKVPAGWWLIADISGSLDGVTKAIQANATIPDHWKQAIIADITARCGADFNFVYLDAHFYVEKANASLHYTCQVDKKLI